MANTILLPSFPIKLDKEGLFALFFLSSFLELYNKKSYEDIIPETIFVLIGRKWIIAKQDNTIFSSFFKATQI
jgi:hypothetical protein